MGYLYNEVSEGSINPNPGYNFVALVTDLMWDNAGEAMKASRKEGSLTCPSFF